MSRAVYGLFIFLIILSAPVLSLQVSSLAKEGPCTISETAPDSFVNNTVNVIDGNFYFSMHHMTVPGHIPLDVIQYYNSKSGYSSWLGRGMSLNHCFSISGKLQTDKKEDIHGKYAAMYVESSGGSIIRCLGKPKMHGRCTFYLDPEVLSTGFTNCGNRTISARTNLKNARIEEDLVHEEYADWTYILPNGTQRRYHRAYARECAMNVLSEKRPNMTRLDFEYYTHGRLEGGIKKIRAFSKKQQHNWLAFDINFHNKKALITSSNGRKATFRFLEKKDDYLIYEIETTEHPKCTFNYEHIEEIPHINQVVWPDGRFLHLEYDKKGRVTCQKAPVGKNGE